jgi:hypothetical protein
MEVLSDDCVLAMQDFRALTLDRCRRDAPPMLTAFRPDPVWDLPIVVRPSAANPNETP